MALDDTDPNMRGEQRSMGGDDSYSPVGQTLHVAKADLPGCKPGDVYTFKAGETDGDGDIPMECTDHKKAMEDDDGKPWEDRFRDAMSPRSDAQPPMPDDTGGGGGGY